MPCPDCSGTGQKRGTTLTCWTCGGLGVVPDTSEEFEKAKKEIEKARREMEEERQEFTERTQQERKFKRKKTEINTEVNTNESEALTGKIFCQCCAKKVDKSSTVKVCLDCFRKIKEL